MIRRGDIIDVNLDPVVGSETGKIRPCIVVTNDIYNERVPVIQVVPITAWSAKKARIRTNVTIEPSSENGLSKTSLADCLQTRPVDRQLRFVKTRGHLEAELMDDIDTSLKYVFSLNHQDPVLRG